VADSQRFRHEANVESLGNLGENLEEHKIDLAEFPLVLQYNKRDIENVHSIAQLEEDLNPDGRPFAATCAIRGDGVYEGLELIVKEVLRDLKKRDILNPAERPASEEMAERLEFGKREDSGSLAGSVQEYSETSNSASMDQLLMEQDAPRDIGLELEEDGVPIPGEEAPRASEEVEPLDNEPPQAKPHRSDRPTIPAPMMSEQTREPLDAADRQPRVASTVPPVPGESEPLEDPGEDEAAEDILDGRPVRNTEIPPLSFVPLWPEASVERAEEIEKAISGGYTTAAVRMIWKEIERLTEEAGSGVPNHSSEQIISLLGLDGRQFLQIARLAARDEDEIDEPAALDAYLFLLQVVRRVSS
jgi:hypothetical protein